jgi:integrase
MARTKARGAPRYLFQRGSTWWLKLQSDDPAHNIVRSLRTTERLEADALAAPLITEHKRHLLERSRIRLVDSWQTELEPGKLHTLADGTRVLATQTELMTLDAAGNITGTRPNGGAVYQMQVPRTLLAPERVAKLAREVEGNATSNGKSSDDELFDKYLNHGGANKTGVAPDKRRQALRMWQTFKQVCGGKRLKDCTRDDGRKVVAYLEQQPGRGGAPAKSGTVARNMVWLVAAVNFAIAEGDLPSTFRNPFEGISPNRKDALEREAFDADDMATIAQHLPSLSPSDQLLVRLLATTGMRISEAFQIDGEEPKEADIRRIRVGEKNDQSDRRIPLPSAVLEYMPAKIVGRLFEGNEKAASARLNEWLDDIGITDARKVVHCFRHRAKDRLRAAGCRLELQHELLGHEHKTASDGYGKGSPATLLREWLDKIGM